MYRHIELYVSFPEATSSIAAGAGMVHRVDLVRGAGARVVRGAAAGHVRVGRRRRRQGGAERAGRRRARPRPARALRAGGGAPGAVRPPRAAVPAAPVPPRGARRPYGAHA